MSNLVVLKEGRWIVDISQVASVFITKRCDNIYVALKGCEEMERFYDTKAECEIDYKVLSEALLSHHAETEI
ncbi:hypothetical protein nACB2_091 [Acinetobacter phage nACB2]|nr:hypothetical protein nACB2_091 [Acinetobacter phage nACB2]